MKFKIPFLILLFSSQAMAGKYIVNPKEDFDEPAPAELLKYEKIPNIDELKNDEIKDFYFHDLIEFPGKKNSYELSPKKVGNVTFLKGKIMGEFFAGEPVLVGLDDGGKRINDSNIVTILIHGTFSPASVFGDNWPNFAKSRAEIIGKTLGGGQIYSFLWSGKNNQAKRKYAANILSKYIAYFFSKDPSTKINLVAHSHGGNVAKLAINYASELITRRPIVDNLINIATPVRKDAQLESTNFFNYYVQISSPSDRVVPVAGLDFKGRPVPKPHRKDRDFADLNIVIEGHSHGKLVKIPVFQYLEKNLQMLKEKYPHDSGTGSILKIKIPKIESTQF